MHQGPGLTNAMTGITEAAKSRTPLLVLAADVAAAAVRSNFRIDVAALATAVGATPERLHSPQTAVADVTRAYRPRRNGSGGPWCWPCRWTCRPPSATRPGWTPGCRSRSRRA